MTRKAVLAVIALVIATSLTLINVQQKRTIHPQLTEAPAPSTPENDQPQVEASRPPSSPEAKPVTQESDYSAVHAEVLRSFSSARIGTEDFQSTPRGFESSLSIDGISLMGSRLFVERRPNRPHIAIVPEFTLPSNSAKHSREYGDEAQSAAKAESLLLKDCEVLSLGSARDIWFYTGGVQNIVPAYAVEIFYRCGRTRKREDWIYADPSLEKLGTVKQRI